MNREKSLVFIQQLDQEKNILEYTLKQFKLCRQLFCHDNKWRY